MYGGARNKVYYTCKLCNSRWQQIPGFDFTAKMVKERKSKTYSCGYCKRQFGYDFPLAGHVCYDPSSDFREWVLGEKTKANLQRR